MEKDGAKACLPGITYEQPLLAPGLFSGSAGTGAELAWQCADSSADGSFAELPVLCACGLPQNSCATSGPCSSCAGEYNGAYQDEASH